METCGLVIASKQTFLDVPDEDGGFDRIFAVAIELDLDVLVGVEEGLGFSLDSLDICEVVCGRPF